jgi:hypothetical protein
LGDDIGDTGRMIQDVRDIPGMAVAIANSEARTYFLFAEPWMIEERLAFFSDGHAEVLPPVDPALAGSFEHDGPFALFMRTDTWERVGPRLRNRYPDAELRAVGPDGSRVVLVEGA